MFDSPKNDTFPRLSDKSLARKNTIARFIKNGVKIKLPVLFFVVLHSDQQSPTKGTMPDERTAICQQEPKAKAANNSRS